MDLEIKPIVRVPDISRSFDVCREDEKSTRDVFSFPFPVNTKPFYQILQEANNSIETKLLSKTKQEHDGAVGETFGQKMLSNILSTLNQFVSGGICTRSSFPTSQPLPHLTVTKVSRVALTGPRHCHDVVAREGYYCGVFVDKDEEDDDGHESNDVTATMPRMLQSILFLILTVSCSVLVLLPRVFGNEIPSLFRPFPSVFYGFNFALMLSAVASVVSLDTMSNMTKLTLSFSGLAVFSILTAFCCLLFSSLIWAI